MKTRSSSPVFRTRWATPTGTSMADPADRQLVVVEHDHPGASHDEPMLGAPSMPLVTEPRSSSHRDALYPVPGLVVQDDVPSPGSLIAFSYSHCPTLGSD